MHLLKYDGCGELILTKDLIEDIPKYAILSHTWGPDEDEVTFHDLKDGSAQSKAGYAKIRFCGEQAQRDGLQHFWVDTCCIDKTSHVQLSEAIASMFRWYRDAAKCYVYLVDVVGPSDDRPETQSAYESEFRKSRWHSRGFTLQELLAPPSVEFFSREWTYLGDKTTLEQQIHESTQIPTAALRGKPLTDFSVDERMRWAMNRSTKRKEDKAYSLMGIFNVFIPLIYGEGDNAFLRLKDEIDRARRAKPQPPQPPSAIIPFRRDRDFVERDVLDGVWQRALEPAARIGLVGLGGVGKSQIAIEYAYRVREAHPMTWVFWVHASSAARFEESYKKIAERVKLAGWNEAKADILGMVYAWLSDENNGRWTMVVDNADSPGVMFEPWDGGMSVPLQPGTYSSSTRHSLADYLPSSTTGSILITSRSREVTAGLIEYDEDILEVRPMDEETAVVLLKAKLRKDNGDVAHDHLVELVQQLDYMPLAISQAAAYINQRAPRITVSAYLKTLTRTDEDRAQLLQIDIRDPRRDGQASNSIVATWHISFEHLRQTRDSAARLLALMCLFDRQAIPDHLLRENYIEDGEGHVDFEEDIAILRAYHLIGFGANNNLFDMHRLVQFSTKKWLELHAELNKWQTRYVNVLVKSFPSRGYENWSTCQALFSHVEALLTYRGDSPNYLEAWATVLERGSWYANGRSQYGIAEKMARASLKALEEVWSVDHVQTLRVLDYLARVLRHQGKYDEAESMERRALAGYEEAYGANDPDTLKALHNLAKVLQGQGKYNEAESMLRDALTGSEKTQGVDHSETLTYRDNLARLLRKQGKYGEAEIMHRLVLDRSQSTLGKDHPDTLWTMHHLARVLRDQGKDKEAEIMYRLVLERRQSAIGKDHPDTLTSMHNLAYVLEAQGKHNEAELLFRRAVAGYKNVLGKDHSWTLLSVRCLVEMLRKQGKDEEAEIVRRQAEM